MKPIHIFSSGVERETAEKFKDIANGLKKKPAHLIREFIIAAVDNRVKITSENKKFHKNLYT